MYHLSDNPACILTPLIFIFYSMPTGGYFYKNKVAGACNSSIRPHGVHRDKFTVYFSQKGDCLNLCKARNVCIIRTLTVRKIETLKSPHWSNLERCPALYTITEC
jgi:hypothetical protein